MFKIKVFTFFCLIYGLLTAGVYALTPWDIPNGVFHYDLSNLDNDNNPSTQPTDGTKISELIDNNNSHTGSQLDINKQAEFSLSWLNNKPALFFDGIDDLYTIEDDFDIASGDNYDEKSFWIVFQTGDDITSLQTLYEQWGKDKWYAIQIENSKLYAWVWNSIDWAAWEQFKIADLWTIETNAVYNVIMYQDSQVDNNFAVYLNGKLEKNMLSVASQNTHGTCMMSGSFDCYMFANWGSIGIWATKNDTLRLSNSTQEQWDELHHFKWYLWELASWNQELTNAQITWLFGYFDEKWWIKKPEIMIDSPARVGSVALGNSEIYIRYNDFQNGTAIDINSDEIELYKWNGTDWWTDISATYIDTANKIISAYEAKYNFIWMTKWKYRLIFRISKNNSETAEGIRDFYVWSLFPNELPSLVQHYDAQDINGNDNYTDEPGNNSRITTWVDKANSFNANQSTNNKKPRLRTNTINGFQAIEFDGNNDIFNISNNTLINNGSSYTQKSFAAVFQTGNDVNTFQTIYEQWGAVRWYSFIVHNGHVYAWVWNNNEWDNGHKYKSVDLWVAQPNTTYFAIIVQDSRSTIDEENTLSIYLNGNLASRQTHVDRQYSHPWRIALGWVSNDTVRASDNTPININEWHYFGGHIWEMLSWNHALDQAEINGVQEYFSQKWWVVVFSEKYPIPSPTSDTTPAYSFITNKSWTLSFQGSCSSTATTATIGDNTINLSADVSGTPFVPWTYSDCSIILTDGNGFDHVLNVTPFEVISTTYTLTEVTAIPSPTSNHFPEYTFYSPINGSIEFSGICSSPTGYATIWNNTISLDYLPDGLYDNCYVKVNNGWAEQSEFLLLSPFEISSSAPVISGSNITTEQLMASGQFILQINYTDSSWIDTNSANMILQKYNSVWDFWESDIAATQMTEVSIWANTAIYQSSIQNYGKYRIQFSIENIHGTQENFSQIFYVDEVNFSINTSQIDLWNINSSNISYSTPVEIQVQTLWAGFDMLVRKQTNFSSHNNTLWDYDGSKWIWYDTTQVNGNLTSIPVVEKFATQSQNINTNWERNNYTYYIRLWAIIDELQSAGYYSWNVNFWIKLQYD